MIEFNDSSVLAQMSYPDMRIAIQYALTYPERNVSPVDATDFTSLPPLTFAKPDLDTFRAPILCREVLRNGGSSGAVLNASNEIAVDAFLSNRIPFLRITDFVEKMLGKYAVKSDPSIEELIEIDKKIRAEEFPG
jgi:1-deoxy-D-xylulose-5-phosphate reductoisomerase